MARFGVDRPTDLMARAHLREPEATESLHKRERLLSSEAAKAKLIFLIDRGIQQIAYIGAHVMVQVSSVLKIVKKTTGGKLWNKPWYAESGQNAFCI
jgi:hypothetical protein